MIPLTQEENLEILKESLKGLDLKKITEIVLLDCDRTLCEQDTSRFLNIYCNLPLDPIKKSFKKHGYTYPGFYNMCSCYSQISKLLYTEATQRIANETELYPYVKSSLIQIQRLKQSKVILVTSGIKEIWLNILRKNELDHVEIIAGSHIDRDSYLIGRLEKELIANYFKSLNLRVLAIGDSDVDTLMLKEADVAGIVVNHRKNADLIPHLSNHPALFQISFNDYVHDNIPKTDYKDLIPFLKDNFNFFI